MQTREQLPLFEPTKAGASKSRNMEEKNTKILGQTFGIEQLKADKKTNANAEKTKDDHDTLQTSELNLWPIKHKIKC